MRKRLVLVGTVIAIMFAGCTFTTDEDETGTLVVNRRTGEVTRVTEDSLLKLPLVNSDTFIVLAGDGDVRDPLIVNQRTGDTVRVMGNSLLRLPLLNDDSFVVASVVEHTAGVSENTLEVTARAKLMTATILWNVVVTPFAALPTSTEYAENFRKLQDRVDQTWPRITVVLKDMDGFTVKRIPVLLHDVTTRIVDGEGEVTGFRYEGTLDESYERIQLVSAIDFEWNF